MRTAFPPNGGVGADRSGMNWWQALPPRAQAQIVLIPILLNCIRHELLHPFSVFARARRKIDRPCLR